MDRHDLPDDAHHQLAGTILDVGPMVPVNALLGERPARPASFTSVASAVTFAITAQRAFRDHNDGNPAPLDVKIGISAGEPITDHNDDLFGASVQLAARLCDSAPAGEIAVSLVVRELCIGKRFHFQDCGPIQLKGLSEPTSLYCVSWRDTQSAPSSPGSPDGSSTQHAHR